MEIKSEYTAMGTNIFFSKILGIPLKGRNSITPCPSLKDDGAWTDTLLTCHTKIKMYSLALHEININVGSFIAPRNPHPLLSVTPSTIMPSHPLPPELENGKTESEVFGFGGGVVMDRRTVEKMKNYYKTFCGILMSTKLASVPL